MISLSLDLEIADLPLRRIGPILSILTTSTRSSAPIPSNKFVDLLPLVSRSGARTTMKRSFSTIDSPSTSAGPSGVKEDSPKVNDSLYELHRPSGVPSVQILFFHGLPLGDYSTMHLSTWECGDGSGHRWPQTWLVQEFPGAHVFAVRYSHALEKESVKSFGMKNIRENLLSDLLQQNIGQLQGCPVVLIGHCIGGLIIKKLCLQARKMLSLSRDSMEKAQLENFLNRTAGIFYYSTPHHGIPDIARAADLVDSPLFKYFEKLSAKAERLNSDFNRLCDLHSTWRIKGLAAALPVQLGVFKGVVVVPEASARMGELNVDTADHFSVCKPRDKTSRRFTYLTRLLHIIVSNPKGLDMGRPVHQSQGIPEYHAGLGRSSHDVVEKLINMEKQKNARVLGIVGMGGIGKTTIAKAVFNKISKEFEYTCFLDNVKEIKSHQLQHRVFRGFYHHGKPLEQKDAHWSTLKGKKTLMVMDDVKSKGKLKELPKPSDFGVGSRLIITSRDKSVLAFYAEYDVYEVDLLRDSEARELFCQRAFGFQKIPQGSQHLEADVTRVLKKCQGLPLTLELVGSYLRGHGKAEFWDETIKSLENVQDITGDQENTLWASLNMSYQSLEQIERDIFLEAATCFFEQPLERALAVWKTDHERSIIGWENILNKSMVKEVRKTKWKIDESFGAFREIDYMEVWVHEHFRDWAKEESGRRDKEESGRRAKKESGRRAKKESGRCMLIGVDEDADRAIDLLRAEEVKFGAVIETLRLRDGSQQAKLQLNLLDKLENLKYLELEGISHKGSTKTCPRLSILRWNYCHDVVNVEQMKCLDFQVLPFNVKQMNNLAILELSKMKIPEEFPEALENLVNLRILSLSYLEGVDRLPERFGNLSSLKQLELEGLQISALPDSFCALSALTDLSIVSCPSLQTLPESFGKLWLEYMWVAKCSILERLPDSFGDLKFLEDLCISGCRTLEVQPKNFQCLSSLKRFQLDSCSQSSRLPNLEELKSLLFVMLDGDSLNLSVPLKKLKLSGQNPEKLSAIFRVLSALEELVVDSSGLRRLPENLSSLSTLKRLTIRCGGLEELPENFGNLCALTDLTLECGNLERLPESFKHLSSLERLEINGCAKLRELPSVGELTALRRLKINRQVFEQFAEIMMLIVTGQTLELLSASFGSLSALVDLDVLDLSELKVKRLPENLGTLSTLQRLTIQCADLDELPEDFAKLSALKDLTLHCPSLKRLPASFKHLSSLERLVMGDNTELPKVGELTSLRRLTIEGRVFDDLSAIKKLQLSGHPLKMSELERGTAVSIAHALQPPEGLDVERPVHQSQRIPEYHAGLGSRSDDVKGIAIPLQEIMSKLQSVTRLCLTGMGGSGKTTLAKVACNELGSHFEYTCFVSDVKSIQGNAKTLKQEVWKQMHCSGQKVGQDPDWSRIRRKRLLLVLDDLSDDRDVNVLSEIADGSSSESRFIATSRKKRLFGKDYEVPLLYRDNARQLFMGYAFPNQAAPPIDLESLVGEIVEQCEGLPLTLEVFGMLLRGRKMKEDWKNALHALKTAQAFDNVNKRLWAKLRVSYDELEENEKQMFLDISTFFTHHVEESSKLTWTLRDAKAAWREVYGVSENLSWESLVNRSLVYNVGEDETMKMHEQLRSLGQKIAAESSHRWSGTRREMLELFNSRDNSLNKDIHAIQSTDFNKERVPVPSSALQKLTNLWYLDFPHHVTIEGARNDSSVLSNLVLLRCKGLQFLDPSCQSRLAVLKLWDVKENYLPHSIGQLSALRIFYVIAAGNLRTLPDEIGKLSRLEFLSLFDCLDLQRLPETLGQLSNLRSLEISFCFNLRTLPQSVGMLSALDNLHLLQLQELQTLPESFGQLGALTRLIISGCNKFQSLPNSFGSLSGLVELRIEFCSELRSLPASFGKLRALSNLNIGYLDKLQTLPESFGELSAFTHLSIWHCKKFTSLPNSFGSLSALVDLRIQDCPKLRSLPDSFGNLRSLSHLDLKGCCNLNFFPESLGQLTQLQYLEISGLIPEDNWTLEGLLGCLAELKALRHLSLRYLAIESIPECIKNLPSLRTLELCVLPLVAELPPWLGEAGENLLPQSRKLFQVQDGTFSLTRDEIELRRALADPGVAHKISMEKVRRSDYGGALAAFAFCYLGDSHPFFLQERGIVKRMMGDLQGALKDLTRALEAGDDYECWKHRAYVKYLLGDVEGARMDAERCLRVKDTRSSGTHCLGELSVAFLEFNLE